MSAKRKALYSYVEAQAVVLALDISSRNKYKEMYRKDLKLPSTPHKVYANDGWNGWPEFLGKKGRSIYSSYSEAQKAACHLGIRSQPDYRKRRCEDPYLPGKPEETYRDIGWSTWFDFLKKSTPRTLATYENAKIYIKQLNITTRDEYRDRYVEDPRLPSCPNQKYKDTGWTNWYDFLGKAKPSFYETYAEAKAAVRALGINYQNEYRQRSYEDPKLTTIPNHYYADIGWTTWTDFFGRTKRCLFASYIEAQTVVQKLGIKSSTEYKLRSMDIPGLPAKPNDYYLDEGWTNWPDFLGKKKRTFYATFTDAQVAAQALGIKTMNEYLVRYREDPKLYSTPSRLYAGIGWSSWTAFLDTERPPYYDTYAEARLNVKALNINTREEYYTRFREDPKLSSNPFKTYANSGWNGWLNYLSNEIREIYPTYIEAQSAAQELGIRTTTEYTARFKEDQRLPAVPYVFYSSVGWIDWYDFLGNERPVDASAEYPNIWADIEKWLENETNLQNKTLAMKSLLGGYFAPNGLPDDTRHVLLRANNFDAEAYQQFITNLAESTRLKTHRATAAFFRWALDRYCTDEHADERIIVPGCRNPFDTVLAGFSDSLQYSKPSQSTKPPLGYEYILRSREFLVPNGDRVFLTKPNFNDLPHLQDFFSSRVDWVDIEKARLDFADQNCIWRLVEGVFRDVNGKRQKVDVYQIWSPVRFVALYTLLRFPLRGQQILWLDSGETDDEIAIFDPDSSGINWKKNDSPLAGKGAKKRRQGAVQRGNNNFPKFYVTTNKTGKRDGGYEIDWIPDDLAYWLVMLRVWQSKYNPLSEPTPWMNIALPTKVNKKILKARGAQSFLFRINELGQPMSTSSAFEVSLPALLFKIQRENENLAVMNPEVSYRLVSPYTPHSLRVSLITAFIADGDAPIHLISKLVGHSSLVMTIYYVKMGSDQMRRSMGDTEKRSAKLATERYTETIREQGIHPVRSQLIVTDGNRTLIESDIPNSACVVFDCGVCPMSAASCHIGGEPITERPNENVYFSVEAGYLGQKNCLRCRFFITGIPFLGGLVALANEISLEIFTECGRYQSFSEEVNRFEQEFYDACKDNKPDLHAHKRKSAIANMEQSASKLDNFLKDYTSANHFVQSALKLMKTNDENNSEENVVGVRLISAGGMEEIGLAFEESKTQYHLLSEICQNATIYQSTNPSRAIPLISQAIDRMAENNNLKPAMFRLTDEQKIIVANELNALLLQRLGSWERIDDLFSGELMLLDVDAHEPKLNNISAEIQSLLSHGSTRNLNNKAVTL